MTRLLNLVEDRFGYAEKTVLYIISPCAAASPQRDRNFIVRHARIEAPPAGALQADDGRFKMRYSIDVCFTKCSRISYSCPSPGWTFAFTRAYGPPARFSRSWVTSTRIRWMAVVGQNPGAAVTPGELQKRCRAGQQLQSYTGAKTVMRRGEK